MMVSFLLQSHNGLNALRANRTTSYPTSSNIMSIDLSCNNISMIEVTFFEPVQVSPIKLFPVVNDLSSKPGSRWRCFFLAAL